MSQQRKSLAAEFKDFILRGNVVDLAVAVVVGAAFGAVVTALVRDILTPIIAAIFGKPDFSQLTFTINGSKFFYGDFLNAVITFVSIAAAVFFFVVKPINFLLERRRRAMAAGDEPDAAELSDEAAILTEIRDLLREQGSRPLG
ncbi:MAG TPA: large conductance mechanosensitive channel protein MscL [Acidimicrobiia bacterium]|jgi:large conductance mechanosensitive channel